MCGLAAIVGHIDVRSRTEVVQRMTDALRHRGPDDDGVHYDEFASLGFRRLAILDLTPTGHQPMLTPAGDCAVVFNGEIYNYVELRDELEGLGHVFRSASDTEVLLHAYLQWGPDCVTRFNGMWAFIISDRRRGVVFGSRDRFGMKPLYRWTGNGCVLVASEIKALRASGVVDTQMNRASVAGFLLEGRLDESTATFYEGITQVGAGSSFEIGRDMRYREWQYWNLDAIEEHEHDAPAAEFADLFEDAVRLHSRSDVPVGVHLSGGLDSTAIICAAVRERRARGAADPIAAFTYHDPEYDETRYVADTVSQTGASLVQLEPQPAAIWNDLKAMLAFQDEPVHSLTPVIGFQLMRLSRERRIPVILNGQGADETLGGYPSYFKDFWFSLLRRNGRAAARREIDRYATATHESAPALMAELLRYSARARLRRFAPYRRLASHVQRLRRQRTDWMRLDAVATYAPPTHAAAPGLRQALIHSVERDPLPIYLRVEDRNAMAHSVEGRLPFLDYRLVSFVFSLAPEWKLRDASNKYVLREAMRNRIPESVRTRPEKMGFPTSSARWLANELYAPARQALVELCATDDEFLHRDTLIGRLDRHKAGEPGHTDILIRAVQFLLWREVAQIH
jgi:asparagine synthase (glutamine-hydrolysing)